MPDEERADERLRRVLASQAQAIRASVLNGVAFNAEDLSGVATPDMLDRITKNALAIQLDNAGFATVVYGDVRDQAINTTKRWHEARISIHLSIDRDTTDGRVPIVVSTVRWEYAVAPKRASRRFAVVSDRDEHREMASDSEFTSAWFVRKENGINAGDGMIYWSRTTLARAVFG